MLVYWHGLTSVYLISIISEICSSSIEFKDDLSYNFWSQPVKMNSMVPMHCETLAFTAGIGQHLKIIRSIRGPKNGNGVTNEVDRVVLATNNRVEDTFRNIKNYQQMLKYDVALEVLGEKGMLTFSIRGVTGEDQGGYLCEVLGLDGEIRTSQMKVLSVLVPITEVFISRLLRNGTEIRVPNGASLGMYENVHGGIACNVHVDNAITDPKVTVTADGKDITSLFTDLAPLDEVVLMPGSAYRYQYTTWRKKSYFTVSPSLQLNEKVIVCSAHTPGYEETTMTASAMLYVEAQPEVNCEKLEYLAKPGDQANLNCQVKSNPDGQIFFRFKDNQASVEEVVRLDAFGKFTERGYDFKADRSGDTTNVSIEIPSVQTEHYNYKYTIEAINEYGTRTQSLYLYKAGRYPSSATSVAISRTLLIIILMVLLH